MPKNGNVADPGFSAVAPGSGFGDYGDDHVRIALIENESRTRQAVRGVVQDQADSPNAPRNHPSPNDPNRPSAVLH